MRLLLPLTLLVVPACFGDKGDPSEEPDESNGSSASDGTDGTGADGTDGAADGSDGAADGSDGAADGTGGTTDGSDGTTTDPTLAIVGSYIDNYGDEHIIREATWTMDLGGGSIYDYTHGPFDNDEGWLVAENGPNNEGEEGLWSRFDWSVLGGSLYVCQTTGTAASEADALDTTPADPDNLSTGCPYYGWLQMTPF